MKKLNVILLFYSMVFFSCSSCGTENTNNQNNNMVLDNINNEVKSEHIDTIDLFQLTDSKWKKRVATDCIILAP